MRSQHVVVRVNLDQVRCNVEAIARRTRVPIIAVVKADAYGLGAARVVEALAGLTEEFAYFSIREARQVGRPGLVIGPADAEPAQYAELGLRPTIMNLGDARRFAGVPVAISVDTGMQRFGCDRAELDDICRHSTVHEIYTHAGSLAGVEALRGVAGGRGFRLHAACTALLGSPTAWLDAVRPGYGMYRGALRVSAPLVSVRKTTGPAGYTDFNAPYVGIILAGYAHHVPMAPVMINGRRQRLMEVGMNSSYVTVDPADRAGDPVILLGDGLGEEELAAHLNVRPHEILCRYSSIGVRSNVTGPAAARPAAQDRAAALS